MKPTRAAAVYENLRSSFWFIPTVMAIAAAFLGFWLVTGSPSSSGAGSDTSNWFYGGDAQGARAVLSAVASSTITVVSITFTITIVILTLTAQQFGPRLLRTFFRDRGTKFVLGSLLGTFVYSLIVLRSIQGDGGSPDVPAHAVTVGVVFGVASIGALIYFIHHVAVSIQASAVIERVSLELHGAIDRLFPSTIGRPPSDPPTGDEDARRLARLGREGRVIGAGSEGYVQRIDEGSLLEVAEAADVMIEVLARPGTFVRRGAPVARAIPAYALSNDRSIRVAGAFLTGRDQTEAQDALFAIDQLVEVAVRALSPGVNDPFTAINCIDRLGAALAELANREPPSPHRFSPAGRLRVVAPPIAFAEALAHALGPICRYGRHDAGVLARVIATLRMLADGPRAGPVRTALADHAGQVHRLVLAGTFDESVERQLVDAARAAMQRVADAGEDPRARKAG